MEYYSAIKTNEIMPLAATWTDLEIIILSKVNKTQKDKYQRYLISYQISYIIYMWNLKYDTNELIYKTETDSQT